MDRQQVGSLVTQAKPHEMLHLLSAHFLTAFAEASGMRRRKRRRKTFAKHMKFKLNIKY